MVHVTLMASWRGEGGSALSPAVAQFVGVMQGILPAAPPAQYDPAGHCVSNPFTQEYPGAAAEGQAAKAPPNISAKAHSQKGRGRELQGVFAALRGLPTRRRT